MNYTDMIIARLDWILYSGNKKLILYPFGEQARLIKSLLNVFFDIEEVAIVDNFLAEKYKKILTVEDLKKMNLDGVKILITSNHLGIADSLREQLYRVVPKDLCIEIFPYMEKKEECVKKRSLEKIKKENLIANNMCYQPKNTKSVFWLPHIFSDWIQQNILLNDDYYEAENLKYVFREFKNGIIGERVKEKGILDIGANIGNHTLYFANEWEPNKVYAFEAVEEIYMILERNIELNKLNEKVDILCCGIGDEEKTASVKKINYDAVGATTLMPNVSGEIEIRPIDSFSFDEEIAFIKIDVEGMELSVLKGAINTIQKYKPYILLESFADKFEAVKEFLQNLGYVYERIEFADYLFYMP